MLDFNCKALLALPVCVFHSVCFGVKHFPVFGATRMEALGQVSRFGIRIRASEVLLVIDVGGNHHSA